MASSTGWWQAGSTKKASALNRQLDFFRQFFGLMMDEYSNEIHRNNLFQAFGKMSRVERM